MKKIVTIKSLIQRNNDMRIISTLALSMLLLLGTPLYGQLQTNGLITHNAARSLGLERAWYLQVPMNPYSNNILDVYSPPFEKTLEKIGYITF